MSKVDEAKHQYDQFDRMTKIIVVSAYGVAFAFFLMLIPNLSDNIGLTMTLLLAVLLIPLVVSLLTENRRLHLILRISIELLHYIDENYKDISIPIDGNLVPLGKNHGKKTNN
jgi:hypothetical protein